MSVNDISRSDNIIPPMRDINLRIGDQVFPQVHNYTLTPAITHVCQFCRNPIGNPSPETPKEFKIGSIVKLKSSSEKMTVIKLINNKELPHVNCALYYNGFISYTELPTDALDIVG